MGLKQSLKPIAAQLFDFDDDILLLENKISVLKEDAGLKDILLKGIMESDATKSEKIKSLEQVLSFIESEKKFEIEITNKIPKKNTTYLRQETDGTYGVDVRNFFMPFDATLPIVTGTNDEKALAGLNWVKKNVIYTPDKDAYNYGEYWAYAYQTLKRKKGDCEDGAILLANILIRSGVPYYRVRVCAGTVAGGGHAYCVYCRETDNEWVVLDWCYWYNNKPVSERPTHKEMRNYFDKEKNFYVWFSWDLKNIYAKEELSTEAKAMFG
jgi:predicted transglutaminase-like cysteine proteinase